MKLYPEKKKTNRKRGRPKQSKEYNLLKRLRNNIASVLLFLKNPSVPFTNKLNKMYGTDGKNTAESIRNFQVNRR